MDTLSTYEFNIGDKLYCYYDNLLYEAKCLKRRIASDGLPEYFIHYCGYKIKFDEWVDRYRVLEINDTNIVHKSTLEYYQSKKKRTYIKAKDKVDKTSPKTSQHSETSPIPRKRGRPFKNANNPPLNETPKLDIGKIDSNVQSTKTCCTSVPLQSIETPRSDIGNSSVSQNDFTRSSSDLANNLANLLERNIRIKSRFISIDPHLFGMETISFSQLKYTESSVKDDKKYTEGINIAKNFELLYLTDVSQITLLPIKIPPLITNIIHDDWTQHDTLRKVLDFPDIHTVADLVYDFIKSQKELNVLSGEKARIYGITLLNLFNYVVNKQLLYNSEKKCSFQNMSFHNWFMKGNANKSRVYVLKEFLERKKMWCYAYGPVHLMRLFVNLSKRSFANDKELTISAGSPIFLWYVENNVDKYFSERRYISTDDSIHDINVNLNSPTTTPTEVIESPTP